LNFREKDQSQIEASRYDVLAGRGLLPNAGGEYCARDGRQAITVPSSDVSACS